MNKLWYIFPIFIATVAIGATLDNTPLLTGPLRSTDKLPAGRVGQATANTANVGQVADFTQARISSAGGKVTATQKALWTAKQDALAGDVAGHYHTSDRNRSNHTGTQSAATINQDTSRRFVSDAQITSWDGKLAPTGNGSQLTGLTKTQVGLGNVDNTSDVNKPISTATQDALDDKQDVLVSGTNIKTINGTSILGSGDLVIEGGGSGSGTVNSGTTGQYAKYLADGTVVSGDTLTADDVPDGTTNKAYTATEQTKLAGIATGATANSTDTQLRDRATHTGTQASSTVTGNFTQSRTHDSADTDTATTSLHHTLGAGANQAAAGDDGRFPNATQKGYLTDIEAGVLTSQVLVDDLMSGGTQKALSAEQGKNLKAIHDNYSTAQAAIDAAQDFNINARLATSTAAATYKTIAGFDGYSEAQAAKDAAQQSQIDDKQDSAGFGVYTSAGGGRPTSDEVAAGYARKAFIDVRDYGVDCTGVENSRTAMQSAADYASTLEGAILFVPPSCTVLIDNDGAAYNIDPNIWVPELHAGVRLYANTELWADGATFETPTSLTQDGPMFLGYSTNNIKIRGGKYLGHKDVWGETNEMAVFHFYKVNDVLVDSIETRNFNNSGVAFWGISSAKAKNFTARNVKMVEMGYRYSDYQHGLLNTAHGNEGNRSSGVAGGRPIHIEFAEGYTIEKPIIDRSWTDAMALISAHNGNIVGGQFKNTKMGALYNDLSSHVKWSNNIIIVDQLDYSDTMLWTITQTVGTGLNDLTIKGVYPFYPAENYYIKITGTGTPNTFQWKKGSGAWSANQNITAATPLTMDGWLQVQFAAATGHTLNNEFRFNPAGYPRGSRGMSVERGCNDFVVTGNIVMGHGREGMWLNNATNVIAENNMFILNGRKPKAPAVSYGQAGMNNNVYIDNYWSLLGYDRNSGVMFKNNMLIADGNNETNLRINGSSIDPVISDNRILGTTPAKGHIVYDDRYMGSDGNWYRCIQSHVVAANKEPGVGANWTSYWVLDNYARTLSDASPLKVWESTSGRYYDKASDTHPTISGNVGDTTFNYISPPAVTTTQAEALVFANNSSAGIVYNKTTGTVQKCTASGCSDFGGGDGSPSGFYGDYQINNAGSFGGGILKQIDSNSITVGGTAVISEDTNRNYLVMKGDNGGAIEFQTGFADVDGAGLGTIQSSYGTSRATLFSSNLYGSTTGNRGGRWSVFAKEDGSSNLGETLRAIYGKVKIGLNAGAPTDLGIPAEALDVTGNVKMSGSLTDGTTTKTVTELWNNGGAVSLASIAAGGTVACSHTTVILTSGAAGADTTLPASCTAGKVITVKNSSGAAQDIIAADGYIDDTPGLAWRIPATGTAYFISEGTTSGWQTVKHPVPDCDNATTSKLLYDVTTNTYTCGTDQGGGSIAVGDTSIAVTDTSDGYITFTEDNAEVARISGAKFAVGSTSPLFSIESLGSTAGSAQISSRVVGADLGAGGGGGIVIQGGNSAGTSGMPKSGERLGYIIFGARDTSGSPANRASGDIYMLATEAQSTTALGGDMIFRTVPNASATRAERMKIKQNGVVHFVPMAAPSTCVVGDMYMTTAGVLKSCTATDTWTTVGVQTP